MGIISAGLASNQNKLAIEKANAEYAKKNSFLDDWFHKQYYSDITKRTDIQNMLKIMDENQEKQARRDEAVAAITGATNSSQLAAKDSRNKSYADALADIASNASTLKDTYLQNYMSQKMSLVDPEVAIRQNNANMWSQTANNMFAAGAQQTATGIDKVVK